MLACPDSKKPRDNTITLINIVFLMLIFFLIAGTIAAPLDPDLKLIETIDLVGSEPPDALILSVDGNLIFLGVPAEVAEYLTTLEDPTIVRVVPDRAVPAQRLVELAAELRNAGVARVMIVTERALK